MRSHFSIFRTRLAMRLSCLIALRTRFTRSPELSHAETARAETGTQLCWESFRNFLRRLLVSSGQYSQHGASRGGRLARGAEVGRASKVPLPQHPDRRAALEALFVLPAVHPDSIPGFAEPCPPQVATEVLLHQPGRAVRDAHDLCVG